LIRNRGAARAICDGVFPCGLQPHLRIAFLGLQVATEGIKSLPRPQLKALRRSVVEKIELDPATVRCQIQYRLKLTPTGEILASPGLSLLETLTRVVTRTALGGSEVLA
jgi:hypothetical protein